jgi:hypothetical protein
MDEALKTLASYDSSTGKAAWAQRENQLGDPQNHPAWKRRLSVSSIANPLRMPEAAPQDARPSIGTDKSHPRIWAISCGTVSSRNIHDVEAACFALAPPQTRKPEKPPQSLAESLESKE